MTTLDIALAGSWAYSLFRYVRHLGVFGLFILSALDSSFLVLPFGNDLMLIAIVSRNRSLLSCIGSVLAAVAGSLLGVFVIDLLMRQTGERGLRRFVSKRKLESLKGKLEDKAWLTLFLATVLPPPFPFTPVVMTASALQTPKRAVFSAVLVGRLVRFTVEAVLAVYFGRRVVPFLNSPIVEYFVYTLIVIAVILSGLSLWKWLRKQPPDEDESVNLRVGRERVH